jgi:hypothetical protein
MPQKVGKLPKCAEYKNTTPSILEACGSQSRERERVNAIQTITTVKKRAKAKKDYGPHEHFGSPLNVCRICGEKYTYVQKPHTLLRPNRD